MRITKVEVNNKPVSIQRNQSECQVVHGNKVLPCNKDNIRNFMKSKEDSFIISFLNKTFISKAPKNWDKKRKSELEYLRSIFECRLKNSSFPNQKQCNNQTQDMGERTPEEFEKYFHPHFNGELKYKKNNVDNKEILATLIVDALKKKNAEEIFNALLPYKEWYEYQKGEKQKKLAKSIANNKIYVASAKNKPSKRMQALDCWANLLVKNETNKAIDPIDPIGLSKLEEEFNLKGLSASLNDSYQDCLASKSEQEEVRSFIFKVNCGIKEKYKQHRRDLCREKKLYENNVQQYSLEVSKYLELYFPVKSSDKKKSFTCDYVAHYLSFETMKKTIRAKVQNGVMQYLIQQGKFLFYPNEEYTSAVLQDIKSREAFCLQFVEACAFAANNLRNVIDDEQKNDILGINELMKSLNKKIKKPSDNTKELISFFALEFLDDDLAITQNQQEISKVLQDFSEFVLFVSAIRSSIQSIRNRVIHFKKEAYEEILDIKTFEKITLEGDEHAVAPQEPCPYSSSYLAELMKKEVEYLPKLFAEKVKSSGLLEWYSTNDILTDLSSFELFSKPLSFVPSFKKVFNYGKNLQFPEGSQDKNIYELSIYFNEYDKKEESADYYQAKRNAFKFVYENIFVNSFLKEENSSVFSKTVQYVISINQKNSKDKFQFIFAVIPDYSEAELKKNNFEPTPRGYLQFLQGMLMDEENKKREKKTLQEDETGHFQRFLYYLFMKGFNSYIETNKNRFAFIDSPKYQFSDTELEKTSALNQRFIEYRKKLMQKKSITHGIEPAKNGQIAFWTFCKMLDARHLNELSNQISKLKQAIRKGIVKDINSTSKDLDACQEIIALCLLSNDTCYSKANSEDITSYVAEDARKSSIYLQSDNKTTVLLRGVKLAEKYATKAKLEAVLKSHQVLKKDIHRWEEKKKNIVANSTDREKIHKEWVNTQDKSNGKLTDKKKKYLELCKEIDDYNWLDNKVHLVHVKKLHDLLIEILARLAGFVTLLDRDFIFLDQFSSIYREGDNYRMQEFVNFRSLLGNKDKKKNKDNKEIVKICYINESQQLNRFNSFDDFTNEKLNCVKEDAFWEQMEAKRAFYKKYFFMDDATDAISNRNLIAHFNYLTKTESEISILDLLSKVRSLVSYDRKLKNAVAKSFIDILDRHGIEIKFKPLHGNESTFEIDSIDPKKNTHLKSKQACIEQVPVDYVKMVKTLLEYKKK